MEGIHKRARKAGAPAPNEGVELRFGRPFSARWRDTELPCIARRVHHGTIATLRQTLHKCMMNLAACRNIAQSEDGREAGCVRTGAEDGLARMVVQNPLGLLPCEIVEELSPIRYLSNPVIGKNAVSGRHTADANATVNRRTAACYFI